MKNLTRILSSLSLTLVMAYSAHAQDVFKTAPVGIGTVAPAQALDVSGSIRFTGALMPGVNAGSIGNIFISGGAPSSSWNGNGTNGQVLISSGGVPTWGSANSALTTSNIVSSAGSSVVVGNGANQVVGIGNVVLDVRGALNGILYGQGTGNSALFTAAGSSGQVLISTGTTAPVYGAYGYWSTTGNSGINPAVNFLGTTDNHRLQFDVLGVNSGSIDPGTATNGSTGFANTYLGSGSSNSGTQAGNNDAGTYNVGIGRGTVASIGASATGNVGMGTLALNNALAAGGSYNVALGYATSYNITSGNGNVAIGGSQPEDAITSGSYNTAFGSQAMAGNNGSGGTGSKNTAVGYYSLFSNLSGASNTAVGEYAAHYSTSSKNTAIGDSTLYSTTSGAYNTALGYQAHQTTATNSNTTAIGYNAISPSLNNTITLGNTSVAYNAISGAGIYLPGYNNLGSFLYTSTPSGLVVSETPGTSGQYLQSNGTAAVPSWATVTPSSGSVTNVTGTAPITVTGTWLVGIQGNSSNAGGVLYSLGSGSTALFTPTPTATGLVLLSGGSGTAPVWGTTPATGWNLTGNVGTTVGVNFVGTTDDNQLYFHNGGSYAENGYSGAIDPQLVGATIKGNTYMGAAQSTNSDWGAGDNDAGTYNVAMGDGALGQITTGANNNVALGYNTNVTYSAQNMTASNDVTVGYTAIRRNVTGSGEIAIGINAMCFLQSVSAPPATPNNYNSAMGYQSMYGTGGGTVNSFGVYNAALGYEALYVSAAKTQASNTTIGYQSSMVTTASKNAAIGDSALYANTTGELNSGLGYKSTVGPALTNATSIGANADAASKSNVMVLGSINGLNGATAYTNVGIGTTIPHQALEVGSTSASIRVDGLKNSGTYNKQISTKGNIVYVNNATGDLYSLPNGTNGQVLDLNTNGVPTWVTLSDASFTRYNVVPGSGSSVSIGNGTGQVVGSGNVSLDVQGTAGGVFYGNGVGTPAAFTPAGTAGNVLLSQGTGVPTWASGNSLLTTYSIINGGASSPVVVTNGTNQVIGSGNVALDVQGTSHGILYGQGTGNSALFTSAGSSGLILASNGTIAPSWVNPATAYNEWAFTGGNVISAPYGTDFLGTTNDYPLQFYGYQANYLSANSVVGLIDPVNQNIYFGGYVNGGMPGIMLDAPTVGSINNVALENGAFGNAPNCCSTTTPFPAGVSNDVFIGYVAGLAFGAVSHNNGNTVIGGSGLRYSNGIPNTVFGVGALGNNNGNTSGSAVDNIAFGYNSQTDQGTGSNNVALGELSLESISSAGNNTAIGYESLNSSNAANNTAIGYEAGYSISSGVGNTAAGYEALYANGTGNYSTGIGYNTVASNLTNATVIGYSATSTTSNSITLGNSSVKYNIATGAGLYLPGYNSLNSFFYTKNHTGLVASTGAGISGNYLQVNSAGVPTWATVTPNSGTVTNVTTTSPITVAGTWNLGISGSPAGGVLYSNGSVSPAAFISAGTSGQYLTSNGTGAPVWATTALAVWHFTGGNNISATYGTNFLGTLNNVPFEIYGSSQTTGTVFEIDPVNQNIIFGGYVNSGSAGNVNSTIQNGSMNNVALGNGAMGGAGNGTSNNVFIGYVAGLPFSGVSNNNGNAIIGDGALRYSNGIPNTALGVNALGGSGTSTNNVAFGYNSGVSHSSGNKNVAIGPNTLNSNPTSNTSIGYAALPSTSGINNTAIGYEAGSVTSSGVGNTSAGYEALFTTTTGNYNTALGASANVALGTLSNTTAIGYQATAPVSNSIVLGNTSVAYNASTGSGLYIPAYTTVGSFYYTANTNGSVALTGTDGPGTNGYYFKSNGPGTAPTWANVASSAGTVTNVTGTAPMVVTGTWLVGIQGTNTGGVLYSAGSGFPAVFTSAGTSGEVLTSTGAGAPTWTVLPNLSWNTVGNSITAGQFLGTTTDEPLVFKTDASQVGVIDPQFEGATTKGNTEFGVNNANSEVGASDNGTYNVVLGSAGGTAGSTGSYNVVAGLLEMNGNGGNTSSSYNIGFCGYIGFRYLTSGLGNIAFGYQSLYGVTTGNYNIGFGTDAEGGANNGDIANYNSAVGYHAYYNSANNETAASMTAIGANALLGTSGAGSKNTAVGDSTLYTNSTGKYNTAFGYFANVASATLTNATSIGYNSSSPANNSITLGNTSDVYSSVTGSGLYVPGYNSAGSLFYTANSNGLVASTGAGSSGQMLAVNTSGVPTWSNVTLNNGTVTSVTGIAPITVAGSWNVSIKGTGANAGGILYSNGSASPAVFTSTGAAGDVLESTTSGVPAWVNIATANNIWGLNGNAGTNPPVNFLGTTNDQSLKFQNNGGAAVGSIDPQFLAGPVTKGNTEFGPPFAGNGSLGASDLGTYNVVLGAAGGESNANGNYNVSVGRLCMNGNGSFTTASYNVGIGGYLVFRYITTGIGNIALGQAALYSLGSGNYNIGIGNLAGDGSNSAAISGYYNSALGYEAFTGASTTSATSNTDIGSNTLVALTTGTRNTAVGDSTLISNSSGSRNTAVGYQANVSLATATNATAIGYKATTALTNTITLGNTSDVYNSSTGSGLYVPGYNSTGSLFYTANTNGLVTPTGTGTSGQVLTSVLGVPTWSNINPSPSTVTNVTTTSPITVAGTWNLGISGSPVGGVLYSNGSASPAAFSAAGTSGQVLVSNGTAAPAWANASTQFWAFTGGNNLSATYTSNFGSQFIGTINDRPLEFFGTTQAVGGIGVLDPINQNVYFGGGLTSPASWCGGGEAAQTTRGFITGSTLNVAIGNGAEGNAVNGTTGNVFMGYVTGDPFASTIPGTIAIGNQSARYATGSPNTVLGTLAYTNGIGSGTSTGTNNLAFGYEAEYDHATGGLRDVAIGDFALFTNSSTSNNTAIGYQASYSTSSGANNTSIGYQAAYSTSTGTGNTALGSFALYSNTTGSDNTAAGYLANVASAALTNTTSVGYQATAPATNTMALGNSAINAVYVPGYNTIGSLLVESATNGLVAGSVGTTGQVLVSGGAGVVPTWSNITPGQGTVTNVSAVAPIYVTPGSTWQLNIQGNTSNTDAGGVLYSNGTTSSPQFTPTPTASNMYLVSGSGGVAPTWQSIYSPTSWLTYGNSGLTPGTNFIGTTDAKRLSIQVNNTASTLYLSGGTVDLPTNLGGNGNVYYGIGTGIENGSTYPTSGSMIWGDVGINNTAIGVYAYHDPQYTGSGTATGNIAIGYAEMNGGLAVPPATSGNNAIQSGNYNIGAGYNSLYELSTGSGNIAFASKGAHDIGVGNNNTGFGYEVFDNSPNTANYVGSFNTATGYLAMGGGGSPLNHGNTSNTAIGYDALAVGYYNRNTAVGSASLTTLSSGEGVTAIGDSAFNAEAITGVNNTGFGYHTQMTTVAATNNTVIGAFAEATTSSNVIILGSENTINAATVNTHVGMGTNTPATDAAVAIRTGHLETQNQPLAPIFFIPQAGAGSGASASIVTAKGATDVAGEISFTTGSSGYAAGAQLQVSFGAAYATAPKIVITPANAAAAAAMINNQVYITSAVGSFTINYNQPVSSSNTYLFNYFAIETQ